MAVQDRNVARSSRLADSGVTAQIPLAPVDSIDTPIWVGRINHAVALGELISSAALVQTADCLIRATVAPNLSAMGEGDIDALTALAAAATISHSGFYQNVDGVPTLVAATTVVLPVFTVLANLWGVVTLQVSAAGVVTAKPAGGTMGYVSADVAQGAAPQPDMDAVAVNGVGDPIPQGVLAVFAFQAGAVDFIGGTDLFDGTDVVASQEEGRSSLFSNLPNTADAWPARNDDMRLFAATKRFLDHTGLRKAFSLPAHIDGAGNTIREGDLICITAAGSGAASAVTLPATATLQFRPFPMQGEGYQSLSASKTR